ncbi:ubiquitin-protein ligase [Trichoderma austrokoningii]
MRGWIACVFLLAQVTTVVCSHDQKPLGSQNDHSAHTAADKHAIESFLDVGAEQDGAAFIQPGSDLVDAALAELRKIPLPPRRKRESSGIFSSALRLLLRTIPTGPVIAPSQPKATATSGPLVNAVELLEQAAQQNNSDALYILADFNFFGNYSHPRNLHAAFKHYQRLAFSHGNTTAQYMLGSYYSTGIGGVVPQDQAKALLYYTFAAVRGDTRAEMAAGFRHLAGIGTTKSCETAVKYYKRVADKAIDWYRSGPPGGMAWVAQSWRIADDYGGLYGEGASASSAGMNAFKPRVNSDANAAIGDIIEYLDLMSQQSDSKATLNLGQIYYEGQRGLDNDFELARKYFLLVASRYWKKDGRPVENAKSGIDKLAGKAAGYLGKMYLRGDGVPQNFDRAKVWFDRGSSQADALSRYGLGLMYLHGHGVKENIAKAVELFKVSADHDYAPAQVQMGQLYLDQGGQEDVRIANNYFELAARYGNIEANYYLAELVFHGLGREKLCSMALSYYKSVAEKAEPLVSSWADANDAYEAKDYDLAFLEYLLAAEQGYERAQTNVAWILDTVQSKLPISELLRKRNDKSGLLDNPALALIYWTRASRQSNIDALVKMGDYYFYGIGTEQDMGKAVQCYTGASDYSQSAQALFNLGWMHENGIGLTQDFHLAKRYYDHALAVNDEAYLPVTLGLLKLRIRSAWNTLTNGPVHSIQDEPKKKKDWSLAEWINNFLEEEGLPYDDDYLDDMYDGTLGDEDEDIMDGIVESTLIIGITLALVLLLWWRQRMQQQHAQNVEEERQNQRPQQGNPINPEDAFPAWAGGGMGL